MCTTVTDDRQGDHDMKKYLAINGITWARVVLPINSAATSMTMTMSLFRTLVAIKITEWLNSSAVQAVQQNDYRLTVRKYAK